MNDGAALLRAIIAQPDEDTPRLIYADWLEECAQEVTCDRCGGNGRAFAPHRGEEPEQYIARRWIDCPKCAKTGCVSDGRRERAEFIRVQIEQSHIPCPPPEPNRGDGADKTLTMLESLQAWRRLWSPRFYELRQKARELWPAAVFNILDEVRPGKVIPDEMTVYKDDERRANPSKPEAYVSRGFIESLAMPAADWLSHADALLAAHPIREVELTTLPDLETAERDDKSSLLEARLAGRKLALTFDWMRQRDQFEWVHTLCAAEWSRVRFTFPELHDTV